MKRVKSNFCKLHAHKDAKPNLRKAIISNCDMELVSIVSACALNVLRGNVRFSDCQKKRLSKFKGRLRTVIDNRVPFDRKKLLINQRGGFLLQLLSAILPAIASFIYNSLKSS